MSVDAFKAHAWCCLCVRLNWAQVYFNMVFLLTFISAYTFTHVLLVGFVWNKCVEQLYLMVLLAFCNPNVHAYLCLWKRPSGHKHREPNVLRIKKRWYGKYLTLKLKFSHFYICLVLISFSIFSLCIYFV